LTGRGRCFEVFNQKPPLHEEATAFLGNEERGGIDGLVHPRFGAFEPTDLILEQKLLALELYEFRIVRGWVIQSILDLALKRPMLSLKFHHVVLQRHVGPSYSIFRHDNVT
jgi:hypothetical protein